MSSINYRPDVDGLRALAVLGVVLYHVNPIALPGGFLGVDVFFVISGYLISRIVFLEISTGSFSFSDFYSRRVQRLFPALAVVLAATIGFGALSLFANEYEHLAKHVSSTIVFLLNFRLMGEAGYFDVSSDTKPLLHLWSLSVEEQFYLIWPVILVISHRGRFHSGWVGVVLIFASFAFALHLAARNLDALYFHPLARFWELLIGATLAWVHHQKYPVRAFRYLNYYFLRDFFSIMGIFIIIGSFFFWSDEAVHPGGLTLLPVLGSAMLIAAGGGAIGNRMLALRPLVWVGLISYPIYLWHWPILSYIRITEFGAPSNTMLWTGAGISVLLAAMTYYFIERPLRGSAQSGKKLCGLVGTMMALFFASRFVVASDGLPHRPVVESISAAETQLKREPQQDSSCLALFPAGGAPVYCRQEHSGDRMIAIIGDSHAHVLFPGVAMMAVESGYGTLLLANSGCPPFDGAVTGRNATERMRCANSIETILGSIERDSRVEAIIIASRGPQYIDGTGFGPAEATYSYPPISSVTDLEVSAKESPRTVFRTGLERSIVRLHQRGERIAYVLQVPELGVPARNCLQRPWTLSKTGGGCEVDFGVYRERMRDYRTLVEEIREKQDYLTVIDLESLFCDKIACSGYRDENLLYADDNHLSVMGSIRAARTLLDALNLDASSIQPHQDRARTHP